MRGSGFPIGVNVGRMRILPYSRKFFGAGQQADIRDWSQQELADFYRAHNLLVQNGVGIGMDRGVSDGGDPWMAFFDVSTQDVFMHVARIGQDCVLVCDQLDLHIRCRTISELISSFEKEVCRIVSVRQQKSGNVILHPAARIIMSISAVFLLFKLENSGVAHAKGAEGEFGSAHDSTRKQEMSLTGRAQTVLARLYDVVDTPAAVASLAGVLLSLEIASLNSRTLPQESAEIKLLDAHDGHDGMVLFADAAIEAVKEAPVENAPIISGSQSPAHEMVVVPIPVEIDMIETSVASAQNSFFAFSTVERMEIPRPSESEPAVIVASAQTASIKTEESASSDKAPEATETLAIHALQVIVDVMTLSTEKPSDSSVGEITLSMLESLIPDLGTSQLSRLSDEPLSDALRYFSAAFGKFEIEASGKYVLMEQEHAASLKNSELGVWQNIMSDGSEIIIVGHIDVIDAAGALFG